MGAKWFGAAVKRKEDPALLAGSGRFVDDVRLPGTLHAAFVRSPHPHAKIRAVRTDGGAQAPRRASRARLRRPAGAAAPQCAAAVRAEPGDHRALHALCAGEHRGGLCRRAGRGGGGRHAATSPRMPRPWSRSTTSRCPGVSDCVAAMEPGSPRAHAGAKSNVAARVPITVGDADAAFAKAAHVVRERIFIHRGGPFFLECRGLVASYDAIADGYTVYISSQGSHRIKRGLLDVLRPQRQPDACDHARCRRRLRPQGRDLSRIPVRRGVRAPHSGGR